MPPKRSLVISMKLLSMDLWNQSNLSLKPLVQRNKLKLSRKVLELNLKKKSSVDLKNPLSAESNISNKERVRAQHCWPFVMGNHGSLVILLITLTFSTIWVDCSVWNRTKCGFEVASRTLFPYLVLLEFPLIVVRGDFEDTIFTPPEFRKYTAWMVFLRPSLPNTSVPNHMVHV